MASTAAERAEAQVDRVPVTDLPAQVAQGPDPAPAAPSPEPPAPAPSPGPLAPAAHNPAGNEGEAPTGATPSAAGEAIAHGLPPPNFNPGPPAPAPKPIVKNPRALQSAALGSFAGVGLFTTGNPETALSEVGGVAWVALQAEAGRTDLVGSLRAAGLSVFVWEASPSRGQAAVDAFGADAYIAQAEGPGQLAAALALEDSLQVPMALVTNLFMDTFPSEWVCLPEAYFNVNANATVPGMVGLADAKGATAIAPVLGVYDGTSEGGRPIALREYADQLAAAGVNSYSIFTAETMSGDDFAYLSGAARAAINGPGPAPSGGSSSPAPTSIETGGSDSVYLDDNGDPIVDDAFTEQLFSAGATDAASLRVLVGNAFVAQVVASGDLYGIGPIAACAVAWFEGLNGGIGDDGWAYGPWQDHLTHFPGRPFYGRGTYNAAVQRWAWSSAGIDYVFRMMQQAGAQGRHEDDAVRVIVTNFEAPAKPAPEIANATAQLHHWLGQGDLWKREVAAHARGPQAGGGGTIPFAPGVGVTPTPSGINLIEAKIAQPAPYKPTGVLNTWRDFVDVFRTSVPAERAKIQSQAESLREVFK